MENIKIKIKRNWKQVVEMNESQVKFINAIRGKDAFLKRVADDFIRKKKDYEFRKNH